MFLAVSLIKDSVNEFWKIVLVVILSLWCVVALGVSIAVAIDDWKHRKK